jgi:hypothetical protein
MEDVDLRGSCCGHEKADHTPKCTRVEYLGAFRVACKCRKFQRPREENQQMDLSQAARW